MQRASIELSLLAAEAGFLEGSFFYYNKSTGQVVDQTPTNTSYINGLDPELIEIPYLYEILDWLRDKHKLHPDIGTTLGENWKTLWVLYSIEILDKPDSNLTYEASPVSNSYTEVLENSLKICLEYLLKDKITTIQS
jgi:hypothetical protein